MRKLLNIIIGWYRFLFKKRSQLSKDRLSICKECELRKGYFCGVCWCELDALSELTEEEGGTCSHPDFNKWIYIDSYHKFRSYNKENYDFTKGDYVPPSK